MAGRPEERPRRGSSSRAASGLDATTPLPSPHQDPPSLLQLNFDQYERYAVLRDVVELFKGVRGVSSCRLLDVGGFSRRLDSTPFLPIEGFLPEDQSLVYDLHDYRSPRYIRGDGLTWPFRSEAFDAVTSCDTLEHVPPPERPAFLDRLLDTSKDLVVVAAPFADPLTNLAEEIYLEFHRKHHLLELPALEEHQRHGLPVLSDVTDAANRHGLPYHAFPSGYLPDWLSMAFLGYVTLNLMGSSEAYLRLQELHNRGFVTQQYVLPSYRRVVVISKTRDEDFLAQVRERFPVLEDRTGFCASSDTIGPLLLAQMLDLRLSQEKQERLVFSTQGWDRTAGEIAPSNSVRRRFVCQEDRLGRVDLLFGTYGRTNPGGVVFRLLEDGEPPREVVRMSIPAAEIEDNRWRPFRFRPIAGSAGKLFWAEISSPDPDERHAVTVYCDQDGQPYLRAYCLVEEESRPVHTALAEKEALLAQRDTRIEALLQELTERDALLAERDEAAKGLQARLDEAVDSTGYRLVAFNRKLADRIFPPGSLRGAPYRGVVGVLRGFMDRRDRRRHGD